MKTGFNPSRRQFLKRTGAALAALYTGGCACRYMEPSGNLLLDNYLLITNVEDRTVHQALRQEDQSGFVHLTVVDSPDFDNESCGNKYNIKVHATSEQAQKLFGDFTPGSTYFYADSARVRNVWRGVTDGGCTEYWNFMADEITVRKGRVQKAGAKPKRKGIFSF